MAGAGQSFALLFDQPTGFGEFPGFGHHREHHIERAAGCSLQKRAGLDLHQAGAAERQPQRAPAHRRVFVFLVAVDIGHRLVAADIDGAEHYRLVARGFQYAAIQALLAFSARQGGRNQELEFGAEQPDAIGAGQRNRGGIIEQAGVHIEGDMAAILGNGRQIAHLGPLFGLTRFQRPHRLIGFDRGRRRPDQQRIVAGVDDQFIAVIHVGKQLIDAAKYGHAHGAGHDDDVRRQAAFFQHHALQVALVIFQQFGRAEIAGNQYGIAGDA